MWYSKRPISRYCFIQWLNSLKYTYESSLDGNRMEVNFILIFYLNEICLKSPKIGEKGVAPNAGTTLYSFFMLKSPIITAFLKL